MAASKETALKNLSKVKKTRGPNKRTNDIIKIIQNVHNDLVEAEKDLSIQAKTDPKWFYRYIWSKIIPNNVKIDLPEDYRIIVTKD